LVAPSALAGCGADRSETGGDGVAITRARILPESDTPLLTRALADRFRLGMAQDEALEILRNAARDTPSAKSLSEATDMQGQLNPIRYELTLIQGKARLVLTFRDKRLAEKKIGGLD
jgi:hypothetical protein